MSFYTEVEFIQLTADDYGAPFALLKDITGTREIRIAVNGYDANRLAISSFKVLNLPLEETSLSLIKKLGGKINSIRLNSKSQKYITCEISLLDATETEQKLECRPGEGILFSLIKEIPILVEESLFGGKEVEYSLKKRIREIQTDQFLSYKLGN